MSELKSQKRGRERVIIVALSVVIAGVALLVPVSPPLRWSIVIGTTLALITGLLTLAIKSAAARAKESSMRPLLKAQGFSFALRLIALAGGVYLVHTRGLSDIGFIAAYFVTTIGQQLIELKAQLAALTSQKEAS